MKVFLAGAVSSAKESQLKKYYIYQKCLNEFFKDICLTTPDDICEYRDECIKNNPNFQKIQIDEVMVKYDLQKVRESDLIVCDLSELSTGMGLELGVAHECNKKVIFFYDKNSHVSNMLNGAFVNSKFIEYENVKDLEEKLKQNLENFL